MLRSDEEGVIRLPATTSESSAYSDEKEDRGEEGGEPKGESSNNAQVEHGEGDAASGDTTEGDNSGGGVLSSERGDDERGKEEGVGILEPAAAGSGGSVSEGERVGGGEGGEGVLKAGGGEDGNSSVIAAPVPPSESFLWRDPKSTQFVQCIWRSKNYRRKGKGRGMGGGQVAKSVPSHGGCGRSMTK